MQAHRAHLLDRLRCLHLGDARSMVLSADRDRDLRPALAPVDLARLRESGMKPVPQRCPWAVGDQYIAYHDTEWGVPLHDDRPSV